MEITTKNNEETPTPSKKPRKFSAKEFRKKIRTANGQENLKEFVELCQSDDVQDYALEYIDSGGTLVEFLSYVELLDKKNGTQALPALQAFTIVLLKAISIGALPNSEENCRELLVKHYSVLKSMLSLNSTSKQRKVALRLLAAMVAVSATVAKDVLSYASFDAPVLEVLTNPEGDRGLRESFIYFLLSFLVNGDERTIGAFLEKRGLLASVFGGLVWDAVETVQLILTTVREKVVEAKFLTKTLKMQVFNTHVVRSLVNLYNWKGPDAGRKTGNFKKRMAQAKVVDADEKRVVTDSVHQFLLVLCTSKYGVIFRDPTVGLSGKTHNSLMLTVLQGLENPWDHTNASELVVKICVACPDLVKPVLKDVVPLLEPRASKKWLNAVSFVKKLIRDVNVHSVSHYFDKLTVKQLALVIQTLPAPLPVLQIVTEQNLTNAHLGIRHELIELLNAVTSSTVEYLHYVEALPSFSPDQKSTLTQLTLTYLAQNLPPLRLLITAWGNTSDVPDPDIPSPNTAQHHTVLLDAFHNYHALSPTLTEDLASETEFLETTDPENFLKAVNLLADCNPAAFLPTTPLFETALTSLFNAPVLADETIKKIVEYSGVFEGCEAEMDVWLNAARECRNGAEIGALFTAAMRLSYENYLEYNKEIAAVRAEVAEETVVDFKSIIEGLDGERNETKVAEKNDVVLSPFVIGIISAPHENATEYLNIALTHLLHSQTSPKVLHNLLLTKTVNKTVSKYFHAWDDCSTLVPMSKKIGSEKISKLSKFLTTDDGEFDLEGTETYQIVFTLKMLTFYLAQTVKNRTITEKLVGKYVEAMKKLLERSQASNYGSCLGIVLKHPFFVGAFSPLRSEDVPQTLCTKFVLEVIKTADATEIERFLQTYRSVLYQHLCTALTKLRKKPPKGDFMDVITLIGLTMDDCESLLKIVTELPSECYVSNENAPSTIVDLLCYILEKNAPGKPFNIDDYQKVVKHLQFLNSYRVELSLERLETAMGEIVKRFPHIVSVFDDDYYKSLILKNVTRSSAKLATILLENNHRLLEVVKSVIDDVIDKRELMFSLLSAVDVDDDIAANVYKKHEIIIVKMLQKPQKTAQYLVDNHETIAKIVAKYATMDEFVTKSHKFETSGLHHVRLLTTVFKSEDVSIVANYITTILNVITNTLKRTELIDDEIVTIVIDYLESKSFDVSDNAAFKTFTKIALKHGLQGNARLVRLLKILADHCTDEDHLATIFEMAISHSETLNILLDNHGVKPDLLRLLLTICTKCKSVISKNHIPVWLGAYEGTVSESDRCLLRLMQVYEAADVGFQEFRPYLWGKAAVGHYSVRYGMETSLWRQPKPVEVLDIFDVEKIKRTIVGFPLTRTLNQDDLSKNYDSDVYDPAFYLPLLSQLLAPESTIRWYHCKFGAIALVIVALSSEDKEIRTAACHVLARFHNHLDAARYGKDRLLWLHFIEAFCRSASTMDDLKISTISGIFMARCALVFNRPDHTLYTALTNYIMAKHHPDLEYVPELLELLHSTDVKHNDHRYFILEVIRDGLKTEHDLKVTFRSMAFKLLMDMYNSSVSNYDTKKLILEILKNAIVLPQAATVLVDKHGLLSWLFGVIRLISHHESELLSVIIKLINELVGSLETDMLRKMNFSIMSSLVSMIDAFKRVKVVLADELTMFAGVLCKVYDSKFLSRCNLVELLRVCEKCLDCSKCYYYLEYGNEFVDRARVSDSLQVLTLKWIDSNK